MKNKLIVGLAGVLAVVSLVSLHGQASAAGGISRVQQATGSSGAASAAYSVPLAGTGAGDFLVAIVGVYNNGSATKPSIKDNGTTHCTWQTGYDIVTTVGRNTVFYCENSPANITSVTVTPNKPSSAIVIEYRGVATAGSFDAAVTSSKNVFGSTSWGSNTIKTTGSGDLLIGVAQQFQTSVSHFVATKPWNTVLDGADTKDGTGDDLFAEDQLNVPAGTYSAAGTGDVHNYSGMIISFKASTAGADTTPPSVPTNLSAIATSTSEIDLSWTQSTDNVGVAGYQIFRCLGVCTPTSQVATTTATAYADTGLAASTSYTYRLTAFDAAGNVSGFSSSTTATTQAIVVDTTPPAAITDLGASSMTQTSTVFTWTAPGNDGDTGTASSYSIRYATFPITAQNFASAAVAPNPPAPLVAGTIQSYTLTGLSPDTSYFVAIETTDAAGNTSDISNVPSFSTLAIVLLPDTTPPTVSFTAPTNGATVSGPAVSVAASASDPSGAGQITSGVADVQFLLDGVDLGAPVTATPYAVSWDSTTVADGMHTLTAVAEDNAGNFSTPATAAITVLNSTSTTGGGGGSSGSSTIQLVQTKANSNGSGSGAYVIGATQGWAASGAGNLVTVLVNQPSGSHGTPLVTDNRGDTYMTACNLPGQGSNVAVFYLQNAPSGITTITVTPQGTQSSGVAAEFSGVATSSALDACSPTLLYNSSMSTWASSPLLTTNTDLAIGFSYTGATGNAHFAPADNWVTLSDAPNTKDGDDFYTEYIANGAQGEFSAGGFADEHNYSAGIVAFRSAAVGTSVGTLPPAFINFSGGVNGSTMTASSLQMNIHGEVTTMSSGANPATGITYSSAATPTLHTPVFVNGAEYTTSSVGFSYDLTQNGNNAKTIGYHWLGFSTSSASVGFFFNFPNVGDSNPYTIAGFVASGMDRAELFIQNNAVGMETASGDSAVTIPITPGTWYWCTIQYVAGGTHSLALYDTNTWTQIGPTLTHASNGADKPTAFAIGRLGGEPGGTSVYYANDIIVDFLTARFPLTP